MSVAARGMILACLVLPATATMLAQAGQDQKAKLVVMAGGQPAGSGGSLSIAFVQIGAPLSQPGANQGSIDLGRLSYFGCSSQPGVRCLTRPGALGVSTDFGIRVDSPGNAARTATVSAFLLAGSSFPVAIDAVQLLPAEQVINPSANYGVVVSHVLSIDVPTTLPAGPLAVTVGVMATPH